MATHGDDSLHDAGIPVSHSYTQTTRGEIEAAARAALNTKREDGMTPVHVANLVVNRLTLLGHTVVGTPVVEEDFRSVSLFATVGDREEKFQIAL